MVGLTQDKSKKKEKSQLEVIRYAPDKGEWQKKMFPSAGTYISYNFIYNCLKSCAFFYFNFIIIIKL